MIMSRSFLPGLWLVGTTKVYSGIGADIVMESISRIDRARGSAILNECNHLLTTVTTRLMYSRKSGIFPSLGAILLNYHAVALAGILVMPALLSLLPLLLARRADGSYDAAKWTRYIGIYRVVPILAVAMWWSACDFFSEPLFLTPSR